MAFPALHDYLKRLPHATEADTRVWIDSDGRAQGRYFNCRLTSAFQPIRDLDSTRITGFEAFVRSYAEQSAGLSIWKLLDHAANDEESVELDRLCRMLHAINFYRQPEALQADLYLSVHDRLLTAVSGNHGMAFRRILGGLGLPINKIILQLPAVTPNQGWLLNYVTDNYRLNGFRFAISASNATEALQLLERVRPDAIKLDAREIADIPLTRKLLQQAHDVGIRLVFKRLENERVREVLRQLSIETGHGIYAQGQLLDAPGASLMAFAQEGTPLHPPAETLEPGKGSLANLQ